MRVEGGGRREAIGRIGGGVEIKEEERYQPSPPSSQQPKETYEYFHLLIQTIIHDQTMSHSNPIFHFISHSTSGGREGRETNRCGFIG